MKHPDISWLNGLLACDECGTTLDAANEKPQFHCPTCGHIWRIEGNTLLAQHGSSLNGLTKSSEAFFNTHALQKPKSHCLDIQLKTLYTLANVDYVARAAALANELASSTIVEIGCGDGRTINALRKDKPNRMLIGIDVSSEKLSAASYESVTDQDQSSDAAIAFVQCQGRRVPIVSEMADLVMLLHVLHHTEGLILVDEASRILKPGGTLLIVDISSHNPFNQLTRYLWNFLPTFLRNNFDQEYIIDGKVPPARLVSPTLLTRKARLAGLSPCNNEDDGLFAFLFVYLMLAMPILRNRYTMSILTYLRKFEQFLILRTPARHFTVGLTRIYSKTIS